MHIRNHLLGMLLLALPAIRSAQAASASNADAGYSSGEIALVEDIELLVTRVGPFSGGDRGEGLDLSVEADSNGFVFAINVAGPTQPETYQVQDVSFTRDISTEGVTVHGANLLTDWFSASLGTTSNDINLAKVMESVRWTPFDHSERGIHLEIFNLEPGKFYRLQLLFAEGCCNRGFDVFIGNVLAVDDFNVPATMGGINRTSRGAVVAADFMAKSETVSVFLDGNGTRFPDRNSTLSAATLESISYVPRVRSITSTRISTFSGGDTGEGLDLDQEQDSLGFVYAINVGAHTNSKPRVKVRDAVFTIDAETQGAFVRAGNIIHDWAFPDFGDSENDTAIEEVIGSVRWADASDTTLDGSVFVALRNLFPTLRYRLQLLFTEQCCDRSFDISVGDTVIANDFTVHDIQNGIGNPSIGVVVTTDFIADSDILPIQLSGINATTPDRNGMLSGLTLEALDFGTFIVPKNPIAVHENELLEIKMETILPGALFGLGPDTPAGISIDPDLGILTWIPNNCQGDAVYDVPITLKHSVPNILPEIGRSIRIIVAEVNTAPNLDPIDRQIIHPNTQLKLIVTAFDEDCPEQGLRYSLDAGAPAGARIEPGTGEFTWTPTAAQAAEIHSITVRVTDDGSPALSSTRTFSAGPDEMPPQLRLEIGRAENEDLELIVSDLRSGWKYLIETSTNLRDWKPFQVFGADADADSETFQLPDNSPEYDLELVSVATPGDLPSNGIGLVIVALVNDASLHIRVFDSLGQSAIDKMESELSGDRADEIARLKIRLTPFPDASSLSSVEIAEIRDIVLGLVRDMETRFFRVVVRPE